MKNIALIQYLSSFGLLGGLTPIFVWFKNSVGCDSVPQFGTSTADGSCYPLVASRQSESFTKQSRPSKRLIAAEKRSTEADRRQPIDRARMGANLNRTYNGWRMEDVWLDKSRGNSSKFDRLSSVVMAGLDPAIQPKTATVQIANTVGWMPGTSPGMTM